MRLPAKSPVVGVPISMTSYDEVLRAFGTRPSDRALVVAVCNVHSVMSARRNAELQRVIRSADIATPDGVPLVWTLRRTSAPEQERVYGPELMRRALGSPEGDEWRHFLYGSTPETLDLLQASIATIAPDAKVVGAYSPPFTPPTAAQDRADVERIRRSGANIIWVGLGMPKQELWMDRLAPELTGTTLVGVGAAFDFIAGTVPEAPEWMMRAGLEWLYRFSQEPRRLWRRYVWNNPAFLALMVKQLLAHRLDSLRR